MLVAAVSLASCTDESEEMQPSTDAVKTDGGKSDVTLQLSVQKPQGWMETRAVETDGGEKGEYMWNWFIVVVKDQSAEENGSTVTKKIIEKIFQSGTLEDEVQSDYVFTSLDHAQTTFYSFANMTLADVGLDGVNEGDELPDGFDDKTFAVEANTASVGSTHIPMSNKEEFTIDASTAVVRLEVVRMFVKVKLELSNESDNDMTISTITLKNVTADGTTDKNNLKLFPGNISNSDTGERSVSLNVADTTHVKHEIQLSGDNTLLSAGAKKDVVFYINESTESNNFELVLKTSMGASTDVLRSAKLDWKSMARNELRVIPVNLNQYKIYFSINEHDPVGVVQVTHISYDGIPYIVPGTYQGNYYHLFMSVYDLYTGEMLTSGVVWKFPNSRFSQNRWNKNIYYVYPTRESYSGRSSVVSTFLYTNNNSNNINAVISTDNKTITQARPQFELGLGNFDKSWAEFSVDADITVEGKTITLHQPYRLSATYIDFSSWDW